MLRLRLAPALAAVVVSVGLVLLAGCSETPSAAYNAADVAFASEMTAHHQQAVQMVDLTDGRDLDPAFRELADGIRDAQQPEIEEMTGWLQAWDKPAPQAATDSHDATDDMHMGGSMDGMMSPAEMAALSTASDATFEPMWLKLMIKHHEGGLAMAQQEVDGGRFPQAVALAEHISATQSDEIARMRALTAQ